MGQLPESLSCVLHPYLLAYKRRDFKGTRMEQTRLTNRLRVAPFSSGAPHSLTQDISQILFFSHLILNLVVSLVFIPTETHLGTYKVQKQESGRQKHQWAPRHRDRPSVQSHQGKLWQNHLSNPDPWFSTYNTSCKSSPIYYF